MIVLTIKILDKCIFLPVYRVYVYASSRLKVNFVFYLLVYKTIMTWFESLFGFKEFEGVTLSKRLRLPINPDLNHHIQNQFLTDTSVNGDVTLISKSNNRAFQVGQFSTPSLFALRNHALGILRQSNPYYNIKFSSSDTARNLHFCVEPFCCSILLLKI